MNRLYQRAFPRISFVVGMLPLLFSAKALQAAPSDYFAIHVTDDQTGRGIPLVELRTTFKAGYITDSNGYVAFNEPGLVGQDVWFDVTSAGYESPKGPFDAKGVALNIRPGQAAEIKLHRINIAERLYRLTGYGIYRHTILIGKTPPTAEPLLNAQVTGQDSVQTALFRGRYLWFWQDTDRLSFTLGNYSMTGATADMPNQLDLDRGINFNYFVDKPGAFARSMAHIPREPQLPIWIDGLSVVNDDRGNEQMLGRYVVANKDLTPAESGLVLWNADKEVFERFKKFDRHDTLAPCGKPLRVRSKGVTYLYFPSPFPLVRVRADFASVSDPASYEAFTCLKPGTEYSKQNPQFHRVDGKLVWSWQRGAHRVGPKEVEEWVKAKLIQQDETPFQLRDASSGKAMKSSGGSIAWNPYLKKWTLLFVQSLGDTALGEIWFATANAPEGPWRESRKIATHAKQKDNNDFYNPIQHDELMTDGRLVYFEGTFTNTFSGNPHPTPYYDYNNIMYRLDVSDPRLNLPEPLPGLSDATAVN